jgi:hypothetical protein
VRATVTPEEVLRVLAPLEPSFEALARVAGIDPKTLRRWRANGAYGPAWAAAVGAWKKAKLLREK